MSQDDPGFAAEAVDALDRRHAWLERERDLDGSNLVCLISPDESGLDASPKFDALMGWREAAGRPGFLLYQSAAAAGALRPRESLAADGFCVQEVLTNVAHALSLRALANLSGRAAHRPAPTGSSRRCSSAAGTSATACSSTARLPSGEPLRVSTWSSLAPLALPTLPRAIAERLVAHLRDAREYALPWPIPSTARSEPAFQRRAGRPVPRYWRGSTWMPTTWLLHHGLRVHGYEEDATAARRAQRRARPPLGPPRVLRPDRRDARGRAGVRDERAGARPRVPAERRGGSRLALDMIDTTDTTTAELLRRFELDLDDAGDLEVHSPITGERVARLRRDDETSTDRKVAAAVEAFDAWRGVPGAAAGRAGAAAGRGAARAQGRARPRWSRSRPARSVQEGLGEVQEMIDICDFAVGLSRQLYGLTIASRAARAIA